MAASGLPAVCIKLVISGSGCAMACDGEEAVGDCGETADIALSIDEFRGIGVDGPLNEAPVGLSIVDLTGVRKILAGGFEIKGSDTLRVSLTAFGNFNLEETTGLALYLKAWECGGHWGFELGMLWFWTGWIRRVCIKCSLIYCNSCWFRFPIQEVGGIRILSFLWHQSEI